MAKVFRNPGSLLVHAACLILAAALLGASLYAYDTYGRFKSLTADLRWMQARRKVVKRQAAEMNRKLNTVRRVQRFMDRASAMGMQPDNWDSFDVNIQGWVSFMELEKLIRQCTVSKDVFFTPIAFAVQTPEVASEKEQNDQVPAKAEVAPDASSDDPGRDVRLILSGAFKIRR